MAVINYTPDNTKIIHNTRVDFSLRKAVPSIHIVQYDTSLPIVKVDLYLGGQPYVIPDNADLRVRVGKKDKTYVYKSVLGCTPDRQTVYFEIDNQMTVLYGDVTPILELSLLGRKAGSSPMYITVDRNPIQNGDVESSNDLPILDNLLEQAEAARDAALISETKAKTSETNSKTSETAAKASQTAAKTSETNSKASETAAKAAQTAAETARSTATTKASEASASAAAALVSQNAAKTSETNSKASETAAKAAQTAAETARSTATTKATEASNSAAAALVSKNAAGTSETNSKASETAAKASQTAAKTSETNSKASETAAKNAQTASETAKTQAQTAKTQAETARTGAEAALAQLSDEVQLAQNARTGAEAAQTAAKTSETNAAGSATTASTKATEASNSAAASLVSQNATKASQTAAKTSETNAASSASTASTKASEASASAAAAKTSEDEVKSIINMTYKADGPVYDKFVFILKGVTRRGSNMFNVVVTGNSYNGSGGSVFAFIEGHTYNGSDTVYNAGAVYYCYNDLTFKMGYTNNDEVIIEIGGFNNFSSVQVTAYGGYTGSTARQNIKIEQSTSSALTKYPIDLVNVTYRLLTKADIKDWARASSKPSYTASEVGAEPAFTKKTAFNKDFGTTSGTVVQGNDSRMTNARPASSVNLPSISANTINGSTHGNAILRQLSGGQVVIGSDLRQLRLTGSTTRPYYTTTDPVSTQGSEIALKSDIPSFSVSGTTLNIIT